VSLEYSVPGMGSSRDLPWLDWLDWSHTGSFHHRQILERDESGIGASALIGKLAPYRASLVARRLRLIAVSVGSSGGRGRGYGHGFPLCEVTKGREPCISREGKCTLAFCGS